MKNNVYMLLCMLTALGGHTPAQCAQQTSNSSSSWMFPAFIGGFFLGSWTMYRSLNRKIDIIRAATENAETLIAKNLNETRAKHNELCNSLSQREDRECMVTREKFKQWIGYYPSQQDGHDTDILWMREKIENEKNRLLDKTFSGLAHASNENASILREIRNVVSINVENNNGNFDVLDDRTEELERRTNAAVALSLLAAFQPRTHIAISIIPSMATNPNQPD